MLTTIFLYTNRIDHYEYVLYIQIINSEHCGCQE